MKKLLLSLTILLGLVAFVHASNLDNAIQWMHTNGLTIYNNATDFNADRGLRRDEAAKFFVQFATLLGKTGYVKTDAQCTFLDINQSWSDLKDIVVQSCKLGLFQGNKGKFSPQNQLTNAQSITVLVRIIAGMQNEVGMNHWADNYYSKANDLNLLNNVDMNGKDNIATRGNVGIIIYDGNKIDTTDINYFKNSTNKISFTQGFDAINNLCKWYDSSGIPNSNRAKAAKIINSTLQYVRDHGQHLVHQYVTDANTTLDNSSNNSDRCTYSRLIDELQSQQGYLKSYKIENGVITIGIDFISYQDDVSQIHYDGPPRLDTTKNTSTKIRYYQLSSNPQLQTLDRDSRGYTTYPAPGGTKYLNDFNVWLNELCNDEPVYNGEKKYEEKRENGIVTWQGYTDEINRNIENGKSHFCLKDRLENHNEIIHFNFNAAGEIQKIDLNRWHLSMAG